MTKTTKCSLFCKKVIFSFAILALLEGIAPAATSTKKNWTLAGEKFVYTNKNSVSSSADSTAKALPSLILEQMAETLERLPRAQEQLDRQLYELQKKRISLFLQLSKEVQTRDSILLGDYSEKQLKRKLKAQDVKVSDISKQIKDNLDEAEKLKQKYAPKIQQDLQREKDMSEGRVVDGQKVGNKFAQFFKGFIPGQEQDSATVENVVFYKNDINQLFDAGEEKRALGYESYEFEKACVDSNVNGLLTGKITVYGSFMSVAVTLYQFPGSKMIGSAMEVGATDDVKAIATSLAMQITPKVADSMPIMLKISVQPEEALPGLVVSIDDVVRKDFSNGVLLQSGVHTLMFASKGYDTISTSYNFSGNREFSVDVNLKLSNEGKIYLEFYKPFEGSIFANGNYSGDLSAESRFGSIKVNNRTVLGHFITKDGLPADFIIPNSIIQNDQYYMVKGKPFDRSAYIEKRRKLMYGSYSVLIVSLLPTFYCYGNSYASAMAYNNDKRVSYDEAMRWQTASNITMGISGACGALFVYELIRYLNAANTVLPAQAKPISKKQLDKIKSMEEQSLQQKMMEQLQQAQVVESEETVQKEVNQ